MVTELIKQSPHSETKISFINPGGKTLEFHLKNKGTIDKIKEGQLNGDIFLFSKFDKIVTHDTGACFEGHSLIFMLFICPVLKVAILN